MSNVKDVFFLRLLQHKDFYYIGMALCSVKLGKPVNGDIPPQMRRRYEYISRGLSALRKRIAGSNQEADDITIMATAYLAELTVSCGCVKRLHLLT